MLEFHKVAQTVIWALKRRPRLALLLRATPPEPLVLAAAAPRSVPRIPAVSLLPVHLLHADAQDKYHGCIRNDMMLNDE